MLRIGNYKQTKEALQAYIDGKDFSKPFVIAGWSGTGKTQMVNEIVKENNLQDLKVVDIHITKPGDEAIQEIISEISSEPTGVTIYLVTTSTSVDPVRDLVQANIDVNYFEVDIDERLEWARSINPETGRRNIFEKHCVLVEENPALLGPNMEELIEWKQQLAEAIQKVLKFDGCDGRELKPLLEDIVEIEQNVYLRSDDVEAEWDIILPKLMQVRPNLDYDGQIWLNKFVMLVGQINSSQYF